MVEQRIEAPRGGSSNLSLGAKYYDIPFDPGLVDRIVRIFANGELIYDGEDMQTVEVNKDRLLATLKVNRGRHREIFLDAQNGYRKQVIMELENMLAEARDNKRIRRNVQLTEPVDQTEDYDAAIAQLEYEVNDTLKLSQQDFRCYVLDQWSWKQQFTTSNSMYASKQHDY